MAETKDVSFEYQSDKFGELWIEATCEVTSRGAMYSDEDGDFGPECFDIDVDKLAAFNVAGVDMFERMDGFEKSHVKGLVEGWVEV